MTNNHIRANLIEQSRKGSDMTEKLWDAEKTRVEIISLLHAHKAYHELEKKRMALETEMKIMKDGIKKSEEFIGANGVIECVLPIHDPGDGKLKAYYLESNGTILFKSMIHAESTADGI